MIFVFLDKVPLSAEWAERNHRNSALTSLGRVLPVCANKLRSCWCGPTQGFEVGAVEALAGISGRPKAASPRLLEREIKSALRFNDSDSSPYRLSQPDTECFLL